MLEEEGRAIEILGFELHEPTVNDFLHMMVADMEEKESCLVSYVLELALIKF